MNRSMTRSPLFNLYRFSVWGAIPAVLTLLTLDLGCSTLKSIVKAPKVDLDHVSVRDAGLKESTFVAHLKLKNPNSFEVKVDEVRYALQINGKDLTSGTLDQGFGLSADGESAIEIPMRIRYADLFGSVKDLFLKKKNEYRVSGDVGVGPLTVPFEKMGEITFPVK